MRTIRQQLLIGLMSGMVITILAVGIGSYLKVRHETNELFDYQLKQIVRSFPANMTFQQSETADKHPGKKIVVQVWDKDHAMVFTSNPKKNLPLYTQRGFFEVQVADNAWRIYSEENNRQVVQVGQLIRDREKIEFSLALRSLIPFLILIPTLAMLIWYVVGRSLQPLTRLATALGERSADALQPLDTHGYTPEMMPIVNAINALFFRVDSSIQLQKMFVADAAHELRTPLAALKLQLQLVERTENEDERKSGIKKLHERLNRATHLVQQLLILARQSDMDEQKIDQTISLPKLARQVVGDFSLLAENKDIDLGVEVQDEDIWIKGNHDALRVMLGNLVDNAIRYTPKGGCVDVCATKENGALILRVTDNGMGIPPQDRERVFDRFYRCEGTGESGSGLGLAIVKNVADLHHAKVSVSAPDDGQGLIVTIAFDAAARVNAV